MITKKEQMAFHFRFSPQEALHPERHFVEGWCFGSSDTAVYNKLQRTYGERILKDSLIITPQNCTWKKFTQDNFSQSWQGD
jgi:hypothetical protein